MNDYVLLTSLSGLRGAPEVPPLYRETSVSRTANVGTVGMNGLIMFVLIALYYFPVFEMACKYS